MRMLGQAPQQRILELVFRSNVTPEIVIDLTSAVTPGKAPAPDAVSGSNALALKFIKPEVQIQALGATQKVIAPYGQPEAGMYLYVLGSLAGAGILGGLLTYGICKDPKRWTPITGGVVVSLLGVMFYLQNHA